MTHEQEYPAQHLHDNNIYDDYENEEDDDADYYDNTEMSFSIVSFGEPDVNEIAQQIVSSVFNIAWDNNIQDNGYAEYDFLDSYEDVFMPDIVESFEEPDVDDVAWQVALIAINDYLDEITHDEDPASA